MSKKLIAVAAAAALALTGLVAVPANSAAATLSISAATGDTKNAAAIAGGDGSSSTAAWELPVPSQDVLRVTKTASRSALVLDVATKENNATVTVTATGGVKLLTAAQYGASTTTTATGTQSLSLTADSAGATSFYVYNTSTSAGSVTVQEVKAGVVISADTKWVKGVTGIENGYKINATVPATAGIGSLVEFSATLDDMFGNKIEVAGSNAAVLASTLPGGSVAMVWNATKKIYEGEFTNRATAGLVGLNLTVKDGGAGAVTAFGTPVQNVFLTVNAADLQAANTALTAQVAALTAQLAASRPKANSVTKKRFNTLARKWNAANPGARVALKK
jgi:hypothetical protein